MNLPVMVMTLSSEKAKNYKRQACSKTTQNVLTTTTYNKKERKVVLRPRQLVAQTHEERYPGPCKPPGVPINFFINILRRLLQVRVLCTNLFSVPTDKFAFCGTKRT
jgi:hypothetical protein